MSATAPTQTVSANRVVPSAPTTAAGSTAKFDHHITIDEEFDEFGMDDDLAPPPTLPIRDNTGAKLVNVRAANAARE
ncbi:MAG: hypothetical protein EOO41_01675 [Methanobacteriota archaeon]|nr:MAG: hypothetical protein EOO41_01675 [Euryarchaeota archaeon]